MTKYMGAWTISFLLDLKTSPTMAQKSSVFWEGTWGKETAERVVAIDSALNNNRSDKKGTKQLRRGPARVSSQTEVSGTGGPMVYVIQRLTRYAQLQELQQ